MTCQFCGSAIHVWWDCPKKPDGWKPQVGRVAQSGSAPQKRSEATVSGSRPDASSVVHEPRVGSNPAPISKLGRPRNGFDKAAYNRDYMRRRRAEQKAKAEIMKQRTVDAQNQLHRMRTITE